VMREPVVYWVGNVPLMHGERGDDFGDELGSPGSQACLCGHPDYLCCPEFGSGGVSTLVIGEEWGGRL